MSMPALGFCRKLLNKWCASPKNSPKTISRWVNLALMPLEERMVLDTGISGGSLPIDIMQPWLALNYLVPFNGVFPDPDTNWQEYDGSPNLGEISLFAGKFAPSGYALANGQTLSIAQYPALFSLLGTIYGGDGFQNFGLPNLQGRTPMGVGNGTALGPIILGESQGRPTVDLLFDNLPAHSHNLLTAGGVPTGEVTGLAGSGVPFSKQIPTLGVNFQVVVESDYYYLGEVALNAGRAALNAAQGQLVPISQNGALFSQIGTTFGGDGVSTFALPDFQGRVPMGAGNGLVQGQMGGGGVDNLDHHRPDHPYPFARRYQFPDFRNGRGASF